MNDLGLNLTIFRQSVQGLVVDAILCQSQVSHRLMTRRRPDCAGKFVSARAFGVIIAPTMVWNRNLPHISSHENAEVAPLKIGGWLTFVAIGLVISFLQNLAGLGQSLIPFRGQVWERLTTPGFSAYHPYWKPAILFGIVSASVTLALSAISLVLFFRKHRFFPTFIVVAIPVIFVFMVASYFLEGLVPAIAEAPAHAEEQHTLIVRFVAMHVWIPYFVLSDRVKRTFVR